MRAALVLGIGFGFISFVACGSANVDSIFGKDCTKDEDCGAGNVCKVGVCLSVGSGGASGVGGATASGGAEASGGQTSNTGGMSAGGTSGGGTPATGGALAETGGFANTGGVVASGGGENTGGTDASGGTGPDAGAGGASSNGGSTGTGGATGTGGSKGTGGSPTGDDGVYCGSRYCPEEQVCCFGVRVGGPGIPTPVSTCSEGACGTTEVTIACSATRDCSGGKKCCHVPNSAQAFQCLDDCPAAEVECTGSNVCKAGEVCCESTNGTGASETPSAVQCKAQCKGENGSNEYILCHSSADCPDRLPRCASSNLLVGFKRCWP